MVYEFGDEEIVVSGSEVTIWPDANSVIEATKGVTDWKPRNNWQYLRAAKPQDALRWLEANASKKPD